MDRISRKVYMCVYFGASWRGIGVEGVFLKVNIFVKVQTSNIHGHIYRHQT